MKNTNPVYVISGGVSKFSKARIDKTFLGLVKEAYDYTLQDIHLGHKAAYHLIDGVVTSYFSDHFTNQLMAGIMVQDHLGLTPKPSHRVEGGGATGGICFQEAWKSIASGYMDICLAVGFETMSRVNTWKGNEFIALASDTLFDYPVGGFYSGYYAMMVARHMKEFGTTRDQLSMVAVKNRKHACYNPFAQNPGDYDLEDIQNASMVSWPLTYLDICTMSDGASAILLASEQGVEKIQKATGITIPLISVAGIGRGTDMMRMADRPHSDVILMDHESKKDYEGTQFIDGKLKYPGIHSFRAGRSASIQAYKMANIKNPLDEIDFIELHDAYSSSEIQTYEDMGLCKYGEGGQFVEKGYPFLPNIHYKFESTRKITLPHKGKLPINPSGGLIACGHPVGATGLMQGVFALWQLQGTIQKHFKDNTLQLNNPKTGVIHSHAGTGTYVSVSILKKIS